MNTKIIYRKPAGGQDRFLLSAAYKKAKDLRRSLENCGDMYIDRLYAGCPGADEAGKIAGACLETGIECVFADNAPDACVPVIPVSKAYTPERLRRNVFFAVLCGAREVEYDSLLPERAIVGARPEPLFHYIQDMNYRLKQYGRTLMALKNTGIYCTADTAKRYPIFAERRGEIGHSGIFTEQELPEDLVIGTFADEENNRYVLYQNVNCDKTSATSFHIELAREFRAYRVNPHNGKQVLVRNKMREQSILIMPGDGDLLRYQPSEEEPFLIEYALKK